MTETNSKKQDEKPVGWKWQYVLPIGLVLGTILTGLYIEFVKKENKRIDFICVADYAIADIDATPYKDFKLFFGTEPIKNASLVFCHD